MRTKFRFYPSKKIRLPNVAVRHSGRPIFYFDTSFYGMIRVMRLATWVGIAGPLYKTRVRTVLR